MRSDARKKLHPTPAASPSVDRLAEVRVGDIEAVSDAHERTKQSLRRMEQRADRAEADNAALRERLAKVEALVKPHVSVDRISGDTSVTEVAFVKGRDLRAALTAPDETGVKRWISDREYVITAPGETGGAR